MLQLGAQFGYVLHESMMDAAEKSDPIDDFNPGVGKIHCKSWQADVSMNGIYFYERFGLLENNFLATYLAQMHIEAIVGVSWMPHRKIWFDPFEKALFIV